MFLQDTVATVGETASLYVSLGNLTSNVQRIKEGTFLGTPAPVILVHKSIPQVAREQLTENESAANFIYKIYEEMNIDTSSQYSSLSEFEFFIVYRSVRTRSIGTRNQKTHRSATFGPDFRSGSAARRNPHLMVFDRPRHTRKTLFRN